ncbi:MAG: hypothetical protein V9E96_04115 [Chitinophagaceae bacterium]
MAYVDDSTSEEIAAQKGTPTTPGSRNKFAEENRCRKFATFYRNA